MSIQFFTTSQPIVVEISNISICGAPLNRLKHVIMIMLALYPLVCLHPSGFGAASLFFTLLPLSCGVKLNFDVITFAQSFSCLSSASRSYSVLCALNLAAFLSSCLSDSHSCNRPPPNLHLILARIDIVQVSTCFTSLPSFLPSLDSVLLRRSESNCQTIINQAPYFNKSLRTVHSTGLFLVTATLQPRVLLYLQLCLTGCQVRGANNS